MDIGINCAPTVIYAICATIALCVAIAEIAHTIRANKNK